MSVEGVSEAGLRLCRLIQALSGYAASGATNSDLATELKTSRPNVTRDMSVLLAMGWARKSDDTGRFYPTPTFSALLFRMSDDFDRFQTRVADMRRTMTGR